MTLSAEKVPGTQIKVITAYGPIVNTVTEHRDHVRHFHQQLTALLELDDVCLSGSEDDGGGS